MYLFHDISITLKSKINPKSETDFKKTMFKNIPNNIFLQAYRVSEDITKFRDKEVFYNEINEKGYIIVDLSNDTKQLIETYGIEHLRNDFIINKDSSYITKGPGKNNKLIKSKYRKGIEFYESKNIEAKFNKKLDTIFKSIHSFLMCSIENLINNITHITSSIINSDPVPENEFNDHDDAQVLHTDFKKLSEKDLSAKDFPLSVIIALEDNTVIRILLKSHKLFNDKTDEIETTEIILTLSKGQMFIFHPNLVHGGWNFKISNIRLHLYLDNYSIFRRPPNITKAWYLSDQIYKRVIGENKKRSLSNLKSMNNNKKFKFLASKQNIINFNKNIK